MSQSDFVTRGQALIGAGQFQEAVKVCRLGLLGRPTTVEGRVVLGQALLALKRFDEVLAEMRVALELDHTSISAQILKGEALLRKGDAHAAVDLLQRVSTLAPADPRIPPLLAEAERASGRPRRAASHPAAGFAGGAPSNGHGNGRAPGAFGSPGADGDSAFSTESRTKNYPGHSSEDLTNDEGVEDTGGSFTRPTSLSEPGVRRSQPHQAMNPDATPPPAVLAVGDRSGTVEVDPDMDGVELGDDDLGDVVAPPSSASRSPGPRRSEGRGQVIPATGAPMAKQPSNRSDGARGADRKAARGKGEISSVELMDDEILEVDESVQPIARPMGGARQVPGPFTAVRNAVNQPSGPMAEPSAYPPPTAASARRTAHQSAQLPPPNAPSNMPPHLAQLIANQPHVMQLAPPQPLPMPPNPRSAIAAALPTQAAMPVPQLFPSNVPASARQTMLAVPQGPQPQYPQYPQHRQQQHQAAAAVDQLFADEGPSSAMGSGGRSAPRPGGAQWGSPMPGGAPARIGPDEMTRQPMPLDPQIAALLEPSGSSGSASARADSSSQSKPHKTGMRKGRSRMQVALWVLVGGVMIGGGVFAGFQIRAMRLGKQITAARGEAVSLANTDTWQGWVGARNRLASIAQASGTLDNRATLARTRALVAYEFGDGLAEAQAAVTELAGQGGLDAELAAAFLALAQHDATAARSAADRALALAANDAAALYASSQAALLAGDLGGAITAGKTALEKEARAMYAVGLARTYAAASAWDDGLAAADQALKATPEHPGALIVRGVMLAEGGRITPGNAAGTEIRGLLEKVVREGTKPVGEQARGVSPMQVAYADLALARVDAARGNLDAAKADMSNALAVGLDEQRFAEEVVETLYAINLLAQGRVAGERALTAWPASRRARTAFAQIAVAQGRAAEALDVLGKAKDAAPGPAVLAVRGTARLAAGDLDGARADFDLALKRAPQLELAIAGRTALDLRMNNLEEAKGRVAKLWKPGATSPAIAIAYASVMRAIGDAPSREQAKAALEKAIAGGLGIDTPRAQLENARLQRDLGDLRIARAAYDAAVRAGSYDARFELGLLMIEDREAMKGRVALDELVKEAGDRVPPGLLLEAARARMLAGDHAAAVQALEALEKLPDVVRWQLDRERGRLAIRRGDPAGAGQALARALDGCGTDFETFLLAAEVAGADLQQAKLVEKLQSLTKQRLKAPLESSIIAGKLALAEDKFDVAYAAYTAARDELEKGHATPRLQAQGEFGRAVVAYHKNDDMTAQNSLDLTLALDPSIYAAYLFLADLVRERAPDRGFELTQLAVKYNPDFIEGWIMYGTLAHRLRKRQELLAAITRVNALAPGSEELRQLQSLR